MEVSKGTLEYMYIYIEKNQMKEHKNKTRFIDCTNKNNLKYILFINFFSKICRKKKYGKTMKN